MKKPIVLALVVAFVLVAGPRLRAQPEGDKKGPAKGPSVLLVNLQKVLDQTVEGKEFLKRTQEHMAAKKKDFANRVLALQQKQKELSEKKSLDDRTPEVYRELEDLVRKQAELKVEEQVYILKLQDQIARRRIELIRGAKSAANKIMKKRGASIVLLTKTGPVSANTEQEWTDEQIFRRVLCYDGDADITTAVVKAMDDWYRKNKRGNGAVPARKETAKKGTPVKEKATVKKDKDDK